MSAASTRCWGRFIAIKEAIEFDGKQDLRTKVMIALFAEVERDLISERTKEGLAAAKAKGKRLGRPEGALGTSRLDGKEQDIRVLLGKDVSKASIAKILDVSHSALSTHPAAAFARVHARWPRFTRATARFGPQPSRRGLITTPCEKSGLAVAVHEPLHLSVNALDGLR